MYVKSLDCEVKNTEISFKDIDAKEGIFIGYFSAFGNKDSDGDVFVKGAFARTLLERGPDSPQPRIKHLLDHNRAHSVARIIKLEEDAKGLKYESKAGRHTLGQDWLKMCEDGLITEHSVGFSTRKKRPEKDAVYLVDVELWEGSSMSSWGSNSQTPIIGVKSDRARERLSLLERAMYQGKYSDEVYQEYLEPEYKRLKSLVGASESKDESLLRTLREINYELNPETALLSELKRINSIFKNGQ